MKSKKAVLIIDSSEANPDLLYATGGFAVPDPVVFLKHGGESILVLSDLELARGKKEAAVSKVIPLSRYAGARGRRSLADIAAALAAERKISRVEVGATFPLAFADALRKKGLKVSCASGAMLFEERMKKSAGEVSLIRKSLADTASAMREATALVLGAKAGKNGVLLSGGKPLTSERIKGVINSRLAGAGYSVSGTIVACGEHSAMPHHGGEGPVFTGRPVVIDIFPRSPSGYFGDMTRTVVHGRPPPEIVRMHGAVLKAQRLAFGMIRHGVKAADVHGAVTEFFESAGFHTDRGETPQGFIHSTGHGLGMGLHEPPSVGPSGGVLREGNVVTVEPGLYYEGAGGVRIEDVVVVTRSGCVNLTRCSKRLFNPCP